MIRSNSIFQDIDSFLTNIVIDKQLLVAITSFLSVLNYIYDFISGSVILQVALALIMLFGMDTSLGCAKAALKNEFRFRVFVEKTGKKVAEYLSYSTIIFCVFLAPIKTITTPIALLLCSYMLLKESASLLKKFSAFFENEGMSQLGTHLDNVGSNLIDKIKKKK